jgi:transcriptional regulator GlxA family with amidase domain
MRVEVLLFDGFDELDSLAPYEVFGHARRSGDVEVTLVTATGQDEIVGGHGVRIGNLRRWTPESADVLVIPGGGASRHGPGVQAELESGVIPRRLSEIMSRAGEGFILASVCSGSLLIAAAGLLKDRPATTHHSVFDKLTGYGARLTHARVVDDGDIVTAGGVTSGIDLALHVIDRKLGSQAALDVETSMEYERRGTVWRQPQLV